MPRLRDSIWQNLYFLLSFGRSVIFHPSHMAKTLRTPVNFVTVVWLSEIYIKIRQLRNFVLLICLCWDCSNSWVLEIRDIRNPLTVCAALRRVWVAFFSYCRIFGTLELLSLHLFTFFGNSIQSFKNSTSVSFLLLDYYSFSGNSVRWTFHIIQFSRMHGCLLFHFCASK